MHVNVVSKECIDQNIEMHLPVFEHLDEILKYLHVFDQSSLKIHIFLKNDLYMTQQVSLDWGRSEESTHVIF